MTKQREQALKMPKEQVLTLPHKMCDIGLTDNVISVSVAISACEEGRQWKHAWTLLHKMRDTGMTANVIILNAALPAREHASEDAGHRHICQ